METLKDIYKAGRDRGFMFGRYACQEWQLGVEVDIFTMVNHYTATIEDPEELEELRREKAHECESANRDYSPFEFTAHALNHYGKEYWEPAAAWERFDAGIEAGIKAAIYLDRRKQRQA